MMGVMGGFLLSHASMMMMASLTSSSSAYYSDGDDSSSLLLTSSISSSRILSKVVSFAASEEEEEEGSGDSNSEEEEEEAEMSAAAAIIVLVLIILTILFEHFKEKLEEAAPMVMGPVMEGLFGELTVLGFLSGVTFCGTQLGVFTKLSRIFLHQEEQEELLETFELVHFMLFFIMVFFVISVLLLLRGAQKMYMMWWTMNNACQDPSYMKEAHAAASTSKPWWKHVPGCGSTNTFAKDLLLFHGLRKEFLLERSTEPPFAPTNLNPDETFEFGRYLFVALAHQMGHIVHLHMTTWLALAVMTIVFYFIQRSIDYDLKTFAWIWAATGWLCYFGVSFFERHLQSILTHLAAPMPPDSDSNDSESGPLISSEDLPSWTKIDLEEYIQHRPLITRLGSLMGHHSHSHGDHHGHHHNGHEKLSRQNSLYWMEAEGPHFYTTLFQIQLLFTSAYISLLVTSFLPFVYYTSDESLSEKAAFTVIALLPILLLFPKSEVAAGKMAIVSNIGCHRRPQIMAQVERSCKTAKSIRSIVMILKLKALAGAAESEEEEVTSSLAPMSSRHQRAASAAFDFFDEDGDGCIQGKKFRAIFDRMGMAVNDDGLDKILKLLDKDNDGHVTKAEFLRFYQSYMIMEMDDASLVQMSHQVFELFDQDNSGYVTPSEFMEIADAFQIGFTIDEVAELLGGLDPEDAGRVGKSGFEKLFLEKQRLLFQEVQLPSLA